MLKDLNKLLVVLSLLIAPAITCAAQELITADLKNAVDFTCNDFQEKAKNCENYTCQTPYSLDPSVKTKWEILGKNNDRCKIAHTTDDIGLRDDEGSPMSITKTCDYDNTGIQNLNSLFDDMQANYFSVNSEIVEGAHECILTSNGQPIQSSLDHLEESQSDLSE